MIDVWRLVFDIVLANLHKNVNLKMRIYLLMSANKICVKYHTKLKYCLISIYYVVLHTKLSIIQLILIIYLFKIFHNLIMFENILILLLLMSHIIHLFFHYLMRLNQI